MLVLYPLPGEIADTVGGGAVAENRVKLIETESASGTVTLDVLSRYPVNFRVTVWDPAVTFVNVDGVAEYVFRVFKKIVAPAGEELTVIFPKADTPAGTSRSTISKQTKNVDRFMPFLLHQ